jgi:hypothetical protein
MDDFPKDLHPENIELLNKVISNKNKHNNSSFRILIHIPPINISPRGFSIFNNLFENLKHMGVSTQCLNFDDNLSDIINSFKPNIFMS